MDPSAQLEVKARVRRLVRDWKDVSVDASYIIQ